MEPEAEEGVGGEAWGGPFAQEEDEEGFGLALLGQLTVEERTELVFQEWNQQIAVEKARCVCECESERVVLISPLLYH